MKGVTLSPFTLIIWGVSFVIINAATHATGYCSIYDTCGKDSLIGKDLPCVAKDQPALKPTEEDLAEVISICGAEWNETAVLCCSSSQIASLKENLKKVDSFISSCPACQKNFRNLFCQFSCSPDQSTFLDVTKSAISIDKHKEIVTEIAYYIDHYMAKELFDSCRNIKFSATNGFAMDLIGGGAKNYKQFLKFLGDKKPLLGGSPLQINFKYKEEKKGEGNLEFLNSTTYACNDPVYKCSCSDCPDICPTLQNISHSKCTVGILPCFSFSVIIMYSVFLIGIVCFYLHQQKTKRTQLLEESPYLGTTSSSVVGLPDSMKNEVYSLNNLLEKWFSKLAFNCASYPATVLTLTLIVTGLLSSGIYFFGELEKDPINLWVSSNANAYKEKEFFDANFGPFYRSEQIYIVSKDSSAVLTDDVVKWWFKTEAEIKNTIVDDVKFEDLCFKLTPDSTCVVESFTQYFDGQLPRNWRTKLEDCTESPVNCLPSFQQPLKREMLFGGYNETESVLSSQAIVVTLLLNNHQEEGELANATKWENALESYLLDLEPPKGVRISFNTESSLESELDKSRNTDVKIVAISYLVMFLYASISVGGSFNILKTRFSLGLSGILIVLLSVTSSSGLFLFFGVKSTLIIAEVIPFLILAVGVDNIFLITHELKSINYAYPNESISFRIAKAVGRMSPSILLSATSQFFTFALASSVSMPAVRNFALYSAGAVLFNITLQLTAFISLLALDQQRIDNTILDCFPCVKLQGNVRLDEVGELFENENESHFFGKILNGYAPFILKFKRNTIFAFIAWFGISLALLPGIKFGLDQRNAVPSDSYLVDYFSDVYDYLNVGPPIYFGIKDLDITKRENQQKLCGKFTTCEVFSLVNVLEQERKRADISTIAEPVSSWLDDYLTFLNPELDDCCRLRKSLDSEVCPPHAPARQCHTCFAGKPWEFTMEGFPENEEFMKYFNIWINTGSDPCALGGKAPYSSSVKYDNNTILSSVFRTSHTPLRSQDDFIKAYEESHRVVQELKKSLDHDGVFAYSPFYIFFIQYSTIIKSTFTLISIALVIIFFNSTIFLGSIRSSLVLITTVIMIIVDICGMMSVWNISLNALSLVNLVICVGLAVEFCVHITRAFIVSDRDSRLNNADFRAFNAITGVGSAVFGGICATKLIGVTVLAFAQSKFFDIYYFRMWFSLVVIASLHALFFLPVALAVVGGKRYVYSENSSGIADDLADRLSEI